MMYSRCLWGAVLTSVFIFAAIPLLRASGSPLLRPALQIRLERSPVPGGAELVTFLSRQTAPGDAEEVGNEVPVLSVLRDTLGDSDPANDRLRQVWVFSYASPSPWQRFVATVPFFYRRVATDRKTGDRAPQPLMDLGNPGRATWRSLAEGIIQTEWLDESGMALRLASRSYRGHAADYRNVHIWQALSALDSAEAASDEG